MSERKSKTTLIIFDMATTKKPAGSGGGNPASDKIQAMKDKIGQGINKGIDAMKKKQEENKAKKEAKKEAKTE